MKMATTGSGAVFFLGTRAHYQVLQQPESQFDAENGNTSTESIYQNPSTGLWDKEHQMDNYINGTNYCNGTVLEEDSTVKRRSKRRPSETALCEDMVPAALNHVDNATPKRQSRIPILAFLSSLSRRKKKLANSQLQQLKLLESSLLTACSYRESCRCLDCQSRYFECDEEEECYSSEDDSEYLYYVAQAQAMQPRGDSPTRDHDEEEDDDDDDEVFVDKVPEDNTSTDLLLETKKMSVSSVATTEPELDTMNLEVAAGTPVLLNYLLTHPVTCAIQ